MIIDSEDNKVSDLIVSFIHNNRIDIRVELSYILTTLLTEDQQKKIKHYKNIKEYCKKLLLDDDFMRQLKMRLSITEYQEVSYKYWDRILDTSDETFNYNEKLEKRLLEINLRLLDFVSELLRELEIKGLKFELFKR